MIIRSIIFITVLFSVQHMAAYRHTVINSLKPPFAHIEVDLIATDGTIAASFTLNPGKTVSKEILQCLSDIKIRALKIDERGAGTVHIYVDLSDTAVIQRPIGCKSTKTVVAEDHAQIYID